MFEWSLNVLLCIGNVLLGLNLKIIHLDFYLSVLIVIFHRKIDHLAPIALVAEHLHLEISPK